VRRYCVHVKGAKAGQPIILEPWQVDLFTQMFGWKRADGTRRYRQVYVELGRKNGKSTLGACLALYMLAADHEGGPQVFSAAKTQQQASLVFSDAAQMVYRSPALRRKYKVLPTIKEIRNKEKERNACYKAISADAGGAHGLNPHAIIFDELHTQTTRDLWDALKTGMGAREQPLMFSITTAGHDRNSICWEQHEYAVAVRDGVVDDPTFLPVIYSADMDDDWTLEETWKKANPNYAVSIKPEFLKEECEKAQLQPSYENTFRQLYLSQWTEQAKRWLPMRHWDDCKAAVPVDLIGARCFAGVDLASTRDITAVVLVFPQDDGVYWVLPWFFVPEEAASERAKQDNVGFRNWGHHFEKTPGNVCDYNYVRRKLNELRDTYQIEGVAFDPWNATHLAQQLQEDGFACTEFRQNFGNFAEPTLALERLVMGHKLQHDGNPVLRWMASNVATKTDASGNVRPDKERSGDKIDGIVALLMGLGSALVSTNDSWAFQPGTLAL
jgi:phage terminase large subunit-like protein